MVLRFNSRRYMTESGKTPEVSKLQSQNKLLENQLAAYRQRIRDLTEHVAKSELDRILLRHGLRDILELPQQENGIDVHMANINGSNTPDLGMWQLIAEQKYDKINPIASISCRY